MPKTIFPFHVNDDYQGQFSQIVWLLISVNIYYSVDSVFCGPDKNDFIDDEEEKTSLKEDSEPKETLKGSLTNPLYLTMVNNLN